MGSPAFPLCLSFLVSLASVYEREVFISYKERYRKKSVNLQMLMKAHSVTLGYNEISSLFALLRVLARIERGTPEPASIASRIL